MEPSLRVATQADLDAVTAVMTTAFAGDPVWGAYSFPDTVRGLDQPAAFWRPYLAAMLRFPWTLVTPGCEAAAVWVPPGEPELEPDQEHELEAALRDLLGDAQAEVVLDVFTRLDAAHPGDEPHHYLSLLGTHADHRGAGSGWRFSTAASSSSTREGRRRTWSRPTRPTTPATRAAGSSPMGASRSPAASA